MASPRRKIGAGFVNRTFRTDTELVKNIPDLIDGLYLMSVHKLSVFHVFEIESSNSRRVTNLNRSPEVAFVRFLNKKPTKAQSG
jgi:hypothetical protein